MNEENLTRILAIDFGLKRIGLALSDPLKTFAYPFQTISNNNQLWKNLLQLVKEKNIERIILGYPSDEGSKNSIIKQICDFKDELFSRTGLGIILWDETFTSEMAKERIIESVSKKSKRQNKGLIDMNSAAIILQEYLDEVKSHPD